MTEHIAAVEDCARCGKPLPLCICDTIEPIDNRVALLILQHPQEQDRALGTARVAAQLFDNSLHRIGLSWPGLGKALGDPTADPQQWAVLYLGSARAGDFASAAPVIAVDRKGAAAEGQAGILRGVGGVIVLDGTWSQAKTLWWRNPWMLKCRRIVLNPGTPSRYGRLRREPRKEGLSTIEAAGMVLAALERRPQIEERAHATFERMLTRYRAVQAAQPELAPKPKPRRPRRRPGRSVA